MKHDLRQLPDRMIVMSSNGEIVWKGSKFVGMKETNNTAEYEGLILGLRAAKTLGRTSDPDLASTTILKRFPRC